MLQLDHEDAHGQYEVNFAFSDALASADHLMLFKLAAQAIAESHGMVFSMMPKPFANQPGSGMHCHVSLWQQDRKNDNRNLFVPHHPDGSIDKTTTLSPIERQFVAGLLDHAPALTALAAPTVNSYKRLTVGESLSGTTWAPAFVAHGPNNRTALVRTLHGRFEWRAPDASANPYLILAGLITAGLDGIERELELGPECTDDLFDCDAAADRRAWHCAAAAAPGRGCRRPRSRRHRLRRAWRHPGARVRRPQAHRIHRVRTPCFRLGTATLRVGILMPSPVGHVPLAAYAALAASMALVGSYVGLSKLLVAVFPVFLLAWLRFGIAAVAMAHWVPARPG